MKNETRDKFNYFAIDCIRDLYVEEMTCDLRDEYYNVLCYRKKLGDHILKMYGYEYIGTREIEDE